MLRCKKGAPLSEPQRDLPADCSHSQRAPQTRPLAPQQHFTFSLIIDCVVGFMLCALRGAATAGVAETTATATKLANNVFISHLLRLPIPLNARVTPSYHRS